MIGAILGDFISGNHEVDESLIKGDKYYKSTYISDYMLLVLKAALKTKGNFSVLADEIENATKDLIEEYPQLAKTHLALFAAVVCAFFARSQNESKAVADEISRLFPKYKDQVHCLSEIIFKANNDYLTEDLISVAKTIPEGVEAREEIIKAVYSLSLSGSFIQLHQKMIYSHSKTTSILMMALGSAYYGVEDGTVEFLMVYLKKKQRWRLYKYMQKFDRKNIFSPISKFAGKLSNSAARTKFIQEFRGLIDQESNLEIRSNYLNILETQGIEWSESSLMKVNVKNQKTAVILSMIYSLIIAENIAAGILDAFIRGGYLDKWLKRLEKLGKKITEPITAPPNRVDIQIVSPNKMIKIKITEKRIRFQERSENGFTQDLKFRHQSKQMRLRLIKLMQFAADVRVRHSQSSVSSESRLSSIQIASRFSDGMVYTESGVYSRANVSENRWQLFVRAFMDITAAARDDMLLTSLFSKALKPREVKYLAVMFQSDGKKFYYRTTNLEISVGDTVYVDTEHRQGVAAKVVSEEFYNWDQVPYPLHLTKVITDDTVSDVGLIE